MSTTLPNKHPLLSIIMPVYNVEDFLEDALKSILGQQYCNYEIIAINDGSQDQSGNILDSYASKDQRIKVYHYENRGLSAARNKGLKWAAGSYVYFFDSDDLLSKNALKSLISLIKVHNCDLIAFSGICIDEKSNPVVCRQPYIKPDHDKPIRGRELFMQMMRSSQYTPVIPMYLFKKEFLEFNSLSFSEGYIHEDEAFTMKALLQANKVCSTSHVYHKHRIRSGSIMAENYGLKNVKGWANAVSQMLHFIVNENYNEQERNMVLKRVRILANNCAGILLEINKQTGNRLSMNDYFSENELNQLGFELKLRFKKPLIYRVYKRLMTLFSTY